MNPEEGQRLGERLSQALELQGLGQTDFARQLGVSATQVSDWIHNRYRPTRATRRAIAALLQISEKWLTDGKGRIYKEGAAKAGRVAETSENYGDSKRWRLVKEIKELVRTASDGVIDALLKNVEQFKKIPRDDKP